MLEQLLYLSAAINRLVEFFKPQLPATLTDDQRKAALVGLSIVLGFLGAAGLQLNILADSTTYSNVNVVVGYFITGVAASFGSGVASAVLGLIYYKKETEKSQTTI